MKKISVITLHRVSNYGSVLQTYATQEVFRAMGFDPETVDYWPKRFQVAHRVDHLYSRFRFRYKNPLVKALFRFSVNRSLRRQDEVFGGFLSRRVKMTRPYLSIDALSADPPAADVYCTGSDQVWNSMANGFVETPFYLDFAPPEKPRIAFSASFGRPRLPEDEMDEIRPMLNRYAGIGVRESSGLAVLEALGVRNGQCTLDPTLVLPPEKWRELAAGGQLAGLPQRYILVYQFNKDPLIDDIADRLAAETGFKVVKIFFFRHGKARPSQLKVLLPPVESFLWLLQNAECVVTNSFHALAFCSVFRKRFAAVYPRDFGVRLNDYLDLTGLKSRHFIPGESALTDVLSEIDYDRVDGILREKRRETMACLEKMLQA